MNRSFEMGVIIGHLEMSWKEDYIKEDLERLKNAIIEGKEFEVARIIGHIEMRSSDQEVLDELNRLWNIMFTRDIDLDSPIIELNLSERTHNCLVRARITTIRELAELSIEGLSKIRNLTKKGTKEICDKMNEIGIQIKE